MPHKASHFLSFIKRISRYCVCISFISLIFSQLNHAKPLRIGVLPAQPPFVFTNTNSQLDGFDIALMRKLCQKLRQYCKFKLLPADHLFSDLLLNKVDLVIGALHITRTKQRYFNFSIPYHTMLSSFVARQEDANFNYSQLPSYRLGVLDDTNQELYLITRHIDKVLNIKRYDSLPHALYELRQGHFDIFLGDTHSILFWIARHGKKHDFERLIRIPSNRDALIIEYGIAISKTKLKLKKALDKEIKKLIGSKTMALLKEHYFITTR